MITPSAAVTRKSTKVCLSLLLAYLAVVARHWIGEYDGAADSTSSDDDAGYHSAKAASETKPKQQLIPEAHSLLPSCNPHWDMKITESEGSMDASLLKIKRIFFYHVRKAGGTMIRTYLHKVAAKYGLHLEMRECQHASAKEEVGIRNDTLYVTNIRDPVERAISHYKFDGRWDCWQLVHNDTFVPTEANARPFEEWDKTAGFEGSWCDAPFSFISCAVNCHVQAFSGRGCTKDGWRSEYNLALERLLRYNLVFVYDRFRDPQYVKAVERFFGVEGFNAPSEMFCGAESAAANRRMPLKVDLDAVVSLTNKNAMDIRLYDDLTHCWREKEKPFSFPAVDASRLVRQRNRTVIE
ncbi:hypothetical protein ACHAXT_000095 [Thalassiosira profunda]